MGFEVVGAGGVWGVGVLTETFSEDSVLWGKGFPVLCWPEARVKEQKMGTKQGRSGQHRFE